MIISCTKIEDGQNYLLTVDASISVTHAERIKGALQEKFPNSTFVTACFGYYASPSTSQPVNYPVPPHSKRQHFAGMPAAIRKLFAFS